MSTARGEDDNSLPENDDNTDFRRQHRFQIVYDWENIEDDDDDGVPLWKAENWIPVSQQLQRRQQNNVRETTSIKVEHDREIFGILWTV